MAAMAVAAVGPVLVAVGPVRHRFRVGGPDSERIWNLAFYLRNPYFSLHFVADPNLPLLLVVALCSSSLGVTRYQSLGDSLRI